MAISTMINYFVDDIVNDIESGDIGLPELQRPFVWDNENVRRFIDSLYRGYPAGYILFWKVNEETSLQTVGINGKRSVPSRAIVDGQQRLTSLYSVITGKPVLRQNLEFEKIQIAFNPLTEVLAVADERILENVSFYPDISKIWEQDPDIVDIADSHIDKLIQTQPISAEERSLIRSSFLKLQSIRRVYSFTTNTLSSNNPVSTIAEVFLRINSEGRVLNNTDFIMTLMSVYWEGGRKELEKFCQSAEEPTSNQVTSYNYFIVPSEDLLLRAIVGLSLKLAQLNTVYNILRGQEIDTGSNNNGGRDEQFKSLDKARKVVLDVGNWHDFLQSLHMAGYRGRNMISSDVTVIYCYVLYLIGIEDYKIAKSEMQQVCAEYFFMAMLTERYSILSESKFESELSRLCKANNGEDYINKLRGMCESTLSDAYWLHTLPEQLNTQATEKSSLSVYFASLVLLNAKKLYSHEKIVDILNPEIYGAEVALKCNYLVPKKFFEELENAADIVIDQVANIAVVELPEFNPANNESYSEYVKKQDENLSEDVKNAMHFWHALPPKWWELNFTELFFERRKLIANVIRTAWKELKNLDADSAVFEKDVKKMIELGESDLVEFKQTMRINTHTGEKDGRMGFEVVRAIAGFLNVNGGTLLIGVSDSGDLTGMSRDDFKNDDAMFRHLTELVSNKIGTGLIPYVHPICETVDDVKILVVRCDRAPKEAFVKHENLEKFYIRGANSTRELHGTEMVDYIRNRFY